VVVVDGEAPPCNLLRLCLHKSLPIRSRLREYTRTAKAVPVSSGALFLFQQLFQKTRVVVAGAEGFFV
jgi:hypothetical protein